MVITKTMDKTIIIMMKPKPTSELIKYITATKDSVFTVGDWNTMTPEEQQIYINT